MKTPAEILGKNANRLPQQSWTSATPTGEDRARGNDQANALPVETKALVNMLFARFMAIYGHKFKSCFETQDEIRIAKREWALSLRGYGEAELVAAIDHCKERLAWMPTISEFLKILQDLGTRGLPGLQRAYEEACMNADHPTRHQWSHAAVYHAGRATGWFRLRTEEQEQVFPDFRYHYGVMVRRVRDGEDLTVPVPVALPDKRDNTLVAFIQRWGKEQGLEPEVAASLLYYLTKPKGSKTRARFRAHAQQEARDKGLDIELPEDYQ